MGLGIMKAPSSPRLKRFSPPGLATSPCRLAQLFASNTGCYGEHSDRRTVVKDRRCLCYKPRVFLPATLALVASRTLRHQPNCSSVVGLRQEAAGLGLELGFHRLGLLRLKAEVEAPGLGNVWL